MTFVVPSAPPAHQVSAPSGALPQSAIPGPPHWAPIQSLLCLLTWPARAEQTAKRLGDIFQIRLVMPREPLDGKGFPLLSGTAVLVSSPELLRELLSRSGPELAGGAARQFTEWFLGPDSLLVLDEEEHREERRALLSLFTPDRLSEIASVTEEVTDQALSRWPSSGSGRLAPLLHELVGEIAVRLMFGRVEPSAGKRLWACVHEGLTSSAWGWPFLLFPWLRADLGRWSPGGRALRARAEFERLLAREASLTRSGARSDSTWLGKLLRLEPEHDDPAVMARRRIARVLTILEGMETVAAALRWAFYHLLAVPAVLARAREEARAGREAYVEAVAKEASRLHPAIPIFARRVMAPTTFAGYELEPRTYLIGCIYLAHRRAEVFGDPHRFLPERFLGRTYASYQYLPFGGGIRRCLGYGFGLRQVSQILGAILRRFDLDGTVRPRGWVARRAVVMLPADPLRVRWRRPTAADG